LFVKPIFHNTSGVFGIIILLESHFSAQVQFLLPIELNYFSKCLYTQIQNHDAVTGLKPWENDRKSLKPVSKRRRNPSFQKTTEIV
jgi:hypothetical protein